jgi:predicted ester cyclase
MTNALSTLQLNKAVSRRFNEEVKNLHRLAVIDELLSPQFVDHSAVPGFANTREGVRDFFALLFAAFPDFSCRVAETIAEDDKVVEFFTSEGTHRGEFMGMVATGRRVCFDGVHIFTLRDGIIIGHRNVLDQLALMRQLGAIP